MKKMRLVDTINNTELEDKFLNKVREKWLEDMRNYKVEEILEEIKNVTEHGANTGCVSFCIPTSDNRELVSENIEDALEFANFMQSNYEYISDLSVDSLVFCAVEEIARKIDFVLEEFEEQNHGTFCLQL